MPMTGTIGNDTLNGTDAADEIYGFDGNDTIDGGAGDDTIYGGLGDDVITDGAGSDNVYGESGFDWIVASADGANDVFHGGWDYSYPYEPLDFITYGNALAGVYIDLAAGTAQSIGSGDAAGIGVDQLTGFEQVGGSAFDDRIAGSSAADYLGGKDGNDTLGGGAGNDELSGGNGDDRLIGGSGLDTARFGFGTAATVSLAITGPQNTGEGNDSLSGIENLSGWKFNDILTGNSFNNVLSGAGGDDKLVGADGNDTLNGGAGVDRMYGGTGDDSYDVDNASDVVVENAGEGIDTVRSGISLTLRANLENLILGGVYSPELLQWNWATVGRGNLDNNVITGNGSANSLFGFAGTDTLDGGEGADRLYGGIGEDILHGGVDPYYGTGADDVLDGGEGADKMYGGAGDDLYYVDNSGDVVVEEWNSADYGQGIDSVISSVSFALSDKVENLTLTGAADLAGKGNDWNNRIVGNSGSNFLYGYEGSDRLEGGDGDDYLDGSDGNDYGNDVLIGGTGDDIYVVTVGDRVVERVGEGYDTVRSAADFVLGSNLEQLELLGTASISGTGNGVDNVLWGNIANNELMGLAGADTLYGRDGNDRLDGGSGADGMYGGVGDDDYVVDDAGDVVVEALDSGNDEVGSTVSYALGANVEILRLLGNAAVNGTGNSLENVIYGNSAANILSGGAGNDELIGGTGNDLLDGGAGEDMLNGEDGNDTYIVDNVFDMLAYYDNGVDTVRSSITLALGNFGDSQENLELTGSADLNGYGNYANNMITGNSGDNILMGHEGSDQLYGGAGNDGLNGGTDDDIASDYLYGGTGNDTLSGGGWTDWLQGGAGRDVMTGGEHADKFVFDDGEFGGRAYGNCDLITDFSQGASDRIDVSLVDANLTTAEDDAFTFIGTAAFSGTAGELRYLQSTFNGVNYTFVQGDVDGDGVYDFLIAVQGQVTLVGSDFVL